MQSAPTFQQNGRNTGAGRGQCNSAARAYPGQDKVEQKSLACTSRAVQEVAAGSVVGVFNGVLDLTVERLLLRVQHRLAGIDEFLHLGAVVVGLFLDLYGKH